MALTRPKYSQIYDSDFKNSARVATTASVTLSGGAPTVVDGVTLVEGDRVLVRVQDSAAQNGIYRVNVLGTGNNGTWGRTLDADTATKLGPGTTLTVEEGSTLAGKLYRMTSTNPITLGSTAITWTDVSGGGGSAGGNNGQIQYNDTNAFGGATYLWYNEVTGTVTANAGVASTSTSTGTMIVNGGVGLSGNVTAGGSAQFSGIFNENTTGAGVFIGNAGLPPASPRIGLFNGNTTQNWQIDNYSGTFRWFTPGVTRMELNATGDLSITSTTTSTSTSTGALKVSGGAGIGGELRVGANVTVTGNVLPSANVTYNLGSPSQRWKDLYLSGTTINLNGATISAASGAITFQNSLGGSFSVTGSSSGQSTGTFGNLVANSGVASSSTSTGALIVTGGVGISGALNVGGDVTVTGGLTVNGTTTNINTTNLVVEDKNIIIADVTTPTDTTADGAGITVKGATDKTFTWVDATDAWTSSEDLNLLTGKQYEINGTSVLTATTLGSGVITSNLTTLGNVTSLLAITSVATNFSTGNAVITGGSLNNTTIGATTHTTGRFTTVTATTVNAGTIGNSGATLTGTLSTAAQTSVTSLGTLTALSVSGTTGLSVTDTGGTANANKIVSVTNGSRNLALIPNIGSGSYNGLSTSGDSAIVATGATIGNGSLTLTTWASATTGIRIASVSNVTTITLAGTTSSVGHILPSANLTYNLGSTTAWWNTLYGVSTQAKYADLAENYQADAQYEPGTVLVFGGAREVTTTDQDHNTAVAGIVSTNPAHLMNGMLTGEGVVALGLTGRLPCRVQGPVAKGDVLVTSTTPGVAQRIDNAKFLPGCVVGKALESINTNNIQTIEVVVGRF